VIMPGMRDLLDSGDIGAAGVSNYSLARWQKADAALGRPVISNQVHFSLANPGALIERDAVQLQPARAGALAPLDHPVGTARSARLCWPPQRRRAGRRVLRRGCSRFCPFRISRPCRTASPPGQEPAARCRVRCPKRIVAVTHSREPNCQVPRPIRLTRPIQSTSRYFTCSPYRHPITGPMAMVPARGTANDLNDKMCGRPRQRLRFQRLLSYRQSMRQAEGER
jgi:hypothetical protein